MAKAVKEVTWHIGKERYYIFCPGCYETAKLRYPDEPKCWNNCALHCFSTEVHSFNGNLDAPSLSPSLLCTYPHGEEQEKYCCHSYVKDGMIQFLGDCTHPLANQTVPLMDVPEEFLSGGNLE